MFKSRKAWLFNLCCIGSVERGSERSCALRPGGFVYVTKCRRSGNPALSPLIPSITRAVF